MEPLRDTIADKHSYGSPGRLGSKHNYGQLLSAEHVLPAACLFLEIFFVIFRTASGQLIRISNGEVLFNSVSKLLYSSKSLKTLRLYFNATNILP